MYTFDKPITKYVAERRSYSVSFRVDGKDRCSVGEINCADSFGPAKFIPNSASSIAQAAREAANALIPALVWPK